MEIILRDYKDINIKDLETFEFSYNDIESIEFIDKRTKIIDYADLELYDDLPHNSLYHLESVKEHINMVISNSKDKFLEVAKYHDIGKFYLQQKRYGYTSFINHEKVSTYLYFCSKKIEDINFKVATIIYLHNKNDFNKYVYCDELKCFREIDKGSSIRLNFKFKYEGKKRKEVDLTRFEDIDKKNLNLKRLKKKYDFIKENAKNYKEVVEEKKYFKPKLRR